MSTADTITIPALPVLQARLRACRDEERELRRLIRMAQAAMVAERARQQREEVPNASR